MEQMARPFRGSSSLTRGTEVHDDVQTCRPRVGAATRVHDNAGVTSTQTLVLDRGVFLFILHAIQIPAKGPR